MKVLIKNNVQIIIAMFNEGGEQKMLLETIDG